MLLVVMAGFDDLFSFNFFTQTKMSVLKCPAFVLGSTPSVLIQEGATFAAVYPGGLVMGQHAKVCG